jgi:hypothetical protein
MKLSTETKEPLMLCIDARLQQIKDSVQSDFIKESEIIDIILMCESLGLNDKAKEIDSDRRFVYENN